MTKLPYFDIQYSPITWTVYTLLFAAEAWGSGNNRVYKIQVSDMKDVASDEQREWFDKEIRVHPISRCFPGDPHKAMAEMKARYRYPTFDEAVDEFRVWLKEQGLSEDDDEIIFKIWW